MRIEVYVSEVQVREGIGKGSGQPYKMTMLTCFDLSPVPAMRLKHAINITLPKDQDHLGATIKDTKVQIDVYAFEADKRGNVEARGQVVTGQAQQPKPAAPAQPPVAR